MYSLLFSLPNSYNYITNEQLKTKGMLPNIPEAGYGLSPTWSVKCSRACSWLSMNSIKWVRSPEVGRG